MAEAGWVVVDSDFPAEALAAVADIRVVEPTRAAVALGTIIREADRAVAAKARGVPLPQPFVGKPLCR